MTQRNRHGIPVYPEPKRPPNAKEVAHGKARQQLCVWPDCVTYAPYGSPFWPICVWHAWQLLASIEAMSTNSEYYREWREAGDEYLQRSAAAQVRREEARRHRPVQAGWIYYVLIDGQIKIGYATDVKKRMRAYPPSSELLAVHPGTLQLEKSIHHEFRQHLARGREWFTDCPEIRERCAATVEQFGDPTPHAYHYGEAQPMTRRTA